ncbi:MAG: PAS domain S-box protein [Gloeomargarita sp. GMQP_bins_14]
MHHQSSEAALRAIVQIQNWLLAAENPRLLYDPILQVLGETVGVSRVYIFEHHWGGQGQVLASQVAEWCAPGIKPERHNAQLQNFDYRANGFDHWLATLQRGQAIYGAVADFPPPERDCLAMQGIVSILVVPLLAGEELYGFIGFDDCVQVRQWQTTEAHLLASVGTAVAQALRQWHLRRALGETEAKYRHLFASASDGILLSDAQTGEILEVNPQLEALLGYPPAELIGRCQWECHPPWEQATAQRDFCQWVQAGGTMAVSARMQRRDGQVIPVEITARVLTWQGRRLLQSAVRPKNDDQVFLEAVPLGMAIFQDRRVRLVNTALCHILGYSRTELLRLSPKGLLRLVHAADRRKLRRAYQRWIQGCVDRVPEELRVWHRDGGLLHLACYGQALVIRGQRLLYITVQDVTEKWRINRALRQSLEQFQLAFERSPIPMSITDTEGRFLRVNAAMGQLLRQDTASLLSEECVHFIHPEDRGRYVTANNRLLAGKIPQLTLELRLQLPSQDLRYIRLSKVAIARDSAGRPLLFLSQLVDLTDQVVAQQSLQESETRLKLAAQTAGLLIWEWDVAKDIMEITRYTHDPGLYPPDEPQTMRLTGSAPLQLVHPEDLPQLLRIRQQYLRGERDKAKERYRVRTADGNWRWLQSISQLLRDGEGQPARVVGVSLDITDQMHLLQTLQAREECLRTVVTHQTELIYRARADGELTFVNPAFCRYAGRSEAQLLHRPFVHPFCAEDQQRFLAHLRSLTPDRPTFTLECRLVGLPEQWYEWTVQGFFDGPGGLQEIQGIGRDITEKKLVEVQLLHKAFHDPLTGLPNRRLFLERLLQALAHCQQGRYPPFVLVFLDLDRFKEINDRLGHLYGDELLVTIARRLQSALPTGDMVARLGGDEFALILHALTPEQLPGRLTQLQRIIAQPLTLAGQMVAVQASMGVVYGHPHYETPEQMLRDADKAMYQAKNQGRSRWVVFTTDMYRSAPTDSAIRTALAEGQLQVHYQPVVTVADGRVLGVEALVRWYHPQQGILAPDSFLGDVAAAGLLGELDWWVLTTAVTQMQQWPAEWMLFVNLSTCSLQQADFAARLADLLKGAGFPPQQLQLEMNEEVMMQADPRWLQSIQDLGIGLSIHGWGGGATAQGGLSWVKTLKFHPAIIAPLTKLTHAQLLVQATVLLAQSLGMCTIAVGVETQQQAHLLQDWGCDGLQGYWVGPPLPAGELTARFALETKKAPTGTTPDRQSEGWNSLR